LQAKVKSDAPLSPGLIADLLRDRRFIEIFERAVELTLPTGNESRLNATVHRLAGAVADDAIFAQLYVDRIPQGPSTAEAVAVIDGAIRNYLKYVARKLLFEAVLDDPDFLYLYEDMIRLWQKNIGVALKAPLG